MAYKDLGCCASDLEAAAAHCGDSAAHITPEEREAWNGKKESNDTLYDSGSESLTTVEGLNTAPVGLGS